MPLKINFSLNKKKIINDPVYGFITIPCELVFDLMEHPYFQRLRRIRQLGMTHLVYPGALHTRFHHALGAMHLMTQAIEIIRSKGHEITNTEMEAVCAAVLLHDIGHGPFSHALENSLVKNVTHETMSLLIMNELNKQLGGKLDLAASIFKDTYHKKFLHQLVSGQLDMDRLDYLARDSFFTGVSEGIISFERIIKMLNVHNDELVIDAKGIYSTEKFIVARRLMYWQVYLHKTVIAAENQLINILKRARELSVEGRNLFTTPPLKLFLENNLSEKNFVEDATLIKSFCALDDYDVFTCIKAWSHCDDFTLSHLSDGLVNRNIYKIKLQDKEFKQSEIEDCKTKAVEKLKIPGELSSYFVFTGTITNNAYTTKEENINILFKGGVIKDLAKASDNLSLAALSKPVIKHFLCCDVMLL